MLSGGEEKDCFIPKNLNHAEICDQKRGMPV
jgi:hypothetical protein